MRAPIHGPLSVEDAGHLGNIVREGFNDPDELVDGVTYVKAAEVIRMLRLVIGAENFRKAVNLYFSRYRGGNAGTNQFFKCFEEVSGRDFTQFRKEWLYTIGYPVIEASWSYDKKSRKLEIVFSQKRAGKGGLFHVPLELAAVDASGKDIPGTARTIEITGKKHKLAFENVAEPAFVSFNRDCSFYGTFTDSSTTREKLVQQVIKDPNRFNRVEAMRRITDMERIKLVKNINASVSEDWLGLYGSILRDTTLPYGLKAYLLRIDEQSLDRSLLPFYRERYAARIRLLKTAAEHCMTDLLTAFNAVDTYAPAKRPKDGIEERQLKAVLLRTIVETNTPATFKLSEEHFHRAWNITDKMSALSAINASEDPRRLNLMQEGYELWKDHLSAYAGYLGIVGSGTHDDVFDMITAEEKKQTYKIHHPTHSRALYLSMGSNNKMLWTKRGIQWMVDTVIKMATINENTGVRLVAAFQQVNQLSADLKPEVAKALETMHKKIEPSAAPSVAGRISDYLC